jgi:hypothetical protein
MQELYVEGVASHDDPESCVVVREGGSEALAGARAGGAIEPRNPLLRDADAVKPSGRPCRQSRYREWLADPARSKNPSMYGNSMRENREVPSSPVRSINQAGRSGKAKAVRLRCTRMGSRMGAYYLRCR